MRELSLFSGGGGGLLGTHWLLGWRAVGYVEWEDYPQRLLAARIKDGLLPDAPIFGDIRTFIRDGYARSYQGMVDVISAGFPCQPFSVAGKQLGENDGRNMWPVTIDVIRRVQPRWVFLENVPGLISDGYVITVVNDLREAGYKVYPPLKLSASDIGANHKRARIWIVADAKSERKHGERRDNVGKGGQRHQSKQKLDASSTPDVAYAAGTRRPAWIPEKKRRQGTGIINHKSMPERRANIANWWTTEPDVGRVANGVASRVDRLKALGNGQVPAVAARAWLELTGGLI